MNDETTIRAKKGPDGVLVRVMPDGSTQPLEDRTDWALLAAMSDEEILAAALSDPDNPPLTEDELEQLRNPLRPRNIRRRLNLTQEQFSEQFHLPLGTIRDWEQGNKQPDSAARVLLRVIEHNPEAVRKALAS